jgi:hypothetical protein
MGNYDGYWPVTVFIEGLPGILQSALFFLAVADKYSLDLPIPQISRDLGCGSIGVFQGILHEFV